MAEILVYPAHSRQDNEVLPRKDIKIIPLKKPIITCDIDGVITKQPKWVRFGLWLMGKLRTPHFLKIRIIRQINLKCSKPHAKNINWLKLLMAHFDVIFVSSRDNSYNENTEAILIDAFGKVYPYYLCDKRENKRDRINEIKPFFHIDDLEYFCRSLNVPYIVVR